MSEHEKRIAYLRAFMQANYDDERLAMLLAHAEDGKLAYYSCCCFIGIATVNHGLQQRFGMISAFARWFTGRLSHYGEAVHLPGARDAEKAYEHLAGTDEGRRETLIPLVRAEIARRDALRSAVAREAVSC